MTVLEIGGPGPDEGAESGLVGRTIGTEGRRNLKRETILNPGVTDGSYCAVRNT